ncbi:unnamed protein product [Citrullus colocynthis]|uniref:Uncharacterized protein n=1 Tax=Citrullus colocynthis TaxID=252529 RepID=A0ABP0XZC9_9ROSI
MQPRMTCRRFISPPPSSVCRRQCATRRQVVLGYLGLSSSSARPMETAFVPTQLHPTEKRKALWWSWTSKVGKSLQNMS